MEIGSSLLCARKHERVDMKFVNTESTALSSFLQGSLALFYSPRVSSSFISTPAPPRRFSCRVQRFASGDCEAAKQERRERWTEVANRIRMDARGISGSGKENFKEEVEDFCREGRWVRGSTNGATFGIDEL